jgi:hypothetical protein
MMEAETVSETLGMNSILTWLIMWEDFIALYYTHWWAFSFCLAYFITKESYTNVYTSKLKEQVYQHVIFVTLHQSKLGRTCSNQLCERETAVRWERWIHAFHWLLVYLTMFSRLPTFCSVEEQHYMNDGLLKSETVSVPYF